MMLLRKVLLPTMHCLSRCGCPRLVPRRGLAVHP